MLVLGIETSCDETGVAAYSSDHGLLAHALHSQGAMHAAYGGVVPELASRDHIRRVVPLIETVLREAEPQLFDQRMIQSLIAGQRRGYANTARLFALTFFELWRREYRVALPG